MGINVKQWFESRTIRFFGLVGVVSAAFIAENLTENDLGTGLSVDLETSIVSIGLAVSAVFFRFITSTGVETP